MLTISLNISRKKIQISFSTFDDFQQSRGSFVCFFSLKLKAIKMI